MGQIRWTHEAERWLKDIREYIARDNPEAAERTVRVIYDKAQLLSDFPELGYRFTRVQDRNVRILLYGHYRIAYQVKENSHIDILGVFHGALDIDRYSL